jgi:gliding motility-associated-like protein
MDFTPDFTWYQLDTLICHGHTALLHFGETDKLIYVIDIEDQIIEIADNRYTSPNLFETTCLDLVFQHPNGKCNYTKTICIEVHDADTTELGIIHLCQGATINIAGHAYSISGKYEVQTQNVKGCDSLIIFEILFRHQDTIEISKTICQGSSIELHGIVYDQPGVYTIQLSDQYECDSIIRLNIELIPSDTLYRKVLHCPAESYKIRDNLIVVQLPFQFQYDSVPDIGCPLVIIESHEKYQHIQFGADIGHTCQNTSEGFIRIFGHDPSDSSIKFEWYPEISNNHMAEHLPPGTYDVTITNSNGCEQQISFLIEEKPIPTYQLQSLPETCPGFEDGQIIVKGEDVVTLRVNEIETTKLHVRDLSPGEYEVTIRFSNGCSITAFILIEKGKSIDYSLPDTIFANYRDREKWLSVPIVWSDLELLKQVIWQSALPLNCTDCPYPNIQVLKPGELLITAKSLTGCTRSDRTILFMEQGFQHFIPDAFTPNGDGINDHWELMGKIDNISALRVQIFNRWGGKIVDNKLSSPFAILWDGKCNQDICPADAYIYLIEWVDEEGIGRNYFGTVSLLK